jgi:hypothetical protein
LFNGGLGKRFLDKHKLQLLIGILKGKYLRVKFVIFEFMFLTKRHMMSMQIGVGALKVKISLRQVSILTPNIRKLRFERLCTLLKLLVPLGSHQKIRKHTIHKLITLRSKRLIKVVLRQLHSQCLQIHLRRYFETTLQLNIPSIPS